MHIRKPTLILALGAVAAAFIAQARLPELIPLVTGRDITPQGKHTEAGSFPVNLVLSPDGRYAVVTNAGYRQFLTVLRVADGKVVSQLPFNKTRNGRKEGLYYGLAWGPAENGKAPLYVSRGAEDIVSVATLDAEGRLEETGRRLENAPRGRDPRIPNHVAGIALSSDGRTLFAANNNTGRFSQMKGSLSIIRICADAPPANRATQRGELGMVGRVQSVVQLPGFPYAVAAVTRGPMADRRVYVTSERDGVVSAVDPLNPHPVRDIATGDHPIALLLNASQDRLYVANAGSDTISVIDTATDRAAATILVRPSEARGLPGATPIGLALSPDGETLYAALADMNCVAVIDVARQRVRGYIPAGWYPTSVAATPDGKRLLVANAKGVAPRNPNGRPVREWGNYIQNILEGTVSLVNLPDANGLKKLTAQTLENNRFARSTAPKVPRLPAGIEHVIYIVKENRTYDQVMGDLPQGNGDPALCLFPREVTPNQHALAERFVLLDNFYVCAEVSADGWDWSTSGMISEYTARNAPYNYSGRGRSYDFEGQNNGVPVDLEGYPDVARSPGGYIWDAVAAKGLTYRNYGFFVDFEGPGDRGPEGRPGTDTNVPNKRALQGHTDEDYLQFDMSYADSDAWVIHNAPCPRQRKTFGRHSAKSRIEEWKREFDEFVRSGSLPRFLMVRLPRNHTSGTAAGLHSPRAMVADNDYAVGQLVEAVSRSPFWPKTAIFILEDDAQNGHDHVDAHRSPCLVISPWVKRGAIDHRFYNTVSVLRTMELLLGVPPICQYDATATVLDVFAERRENAAAYTAILPDKRIIGEVNGRNAYRSRDSERMNFRVADDAPESDLNDILWHAVKGPNVPAPAIRTTGWPALPHSEAVRVRSRSRAAR